MHEIKAVTKVQQMQSLLVIGAASLLLTACNTTAAMHVPKAKVQTDRADLRSTESVATFALDRVVNGIERRAQIFAFPASAPTSGTLCNYRMSGDENVSYANGKRYLGNWSSLFGEIFHDEISQKGYRIEGDPKAVFSQARDVSQSEYLVGGRLNSMKGNFCQEHHWWDARPLDKFSGELYVEVTWSVLDTLTKKVVMTKTFNGYAKTQNPVREGISRTFEQAFADTVDKLATDPEMVALASRKESSIGQRAPQPNTKSGSASVPLVAIQPGPRSSSFAAASAARNVVTVRLGRGHGSGFFIGRDGYVLTNAHVVGNAGRVQLVMSNGAETPARVVRVDSERDVALLKADIKRTSALAINSRFPDVAETVYAIGSPTKEGMSSTVTKGIVSARRVLRKDGQEFIQSDASISPGNSGGPLLNDKGAVIGIAVATLNNPSARNINFFIPIADALKSVSVKLAAGA
jgi:serine protease Do